MNPIVFRNSGVIDIRSITTFGVSSKETANAIGYFGTGLKYAIAILLREGCEITIYAGAQKLEFSKRAERIRVDDFEIVTMNGEPLGFTTELGKNWQLWQAFRELYCNCTDEHGEIYEAYSYDLADFTPKENETAILVSGEPFRDVWSMRSEIILSSEPFIKTEWCNIHHGMTNYIFYRGIRVAELPRLSLFTYDIQSKLTLTEDRTPADPWFVDYYVKQALLSLEDKTTIKRIVTAVE